jgi:hypothetical protein
LDDELEGMDTDRQLEKKVASKTPETKQADLRGAKSVVSGLGEAWMDDMQAGVYISQLYEAEGYEQRATELVERLAEGDIEAGLGLQHDGGVLRQGQDRKIVSDIQAEKVDKEVVPSDYLIQHETDVLVLGTEDTDGVGLSQNQDVGGGQGR